MIVSENRSSTFNMDVPKGKVSSLHVRVNNEEIFQKRVRQEMQLKDEGVLLEQDHFKQWRTKLDQLKQVVRPQNPKELFIHRSKFTLGKRRAQTLESRLNIDSIASTNLDVGSDDRSIASKDMLDTKVASTNDLNDKDDGQAVGSASSSPIKEEVTEMGDDVTQQLSDNNRNNTVLQQPSSMDLEISKSRLISQESCLGYLYPKKVEQSQDSLSANIGSRLGSHNRIILRTDSRSKARAPVASNLESLLYKPTKIYGADGRLLGFENLKWPTYQTFPESYLEEEMQRLKQEQEELKGQQYAGQEDSLKASLTGEIFSTNQDSIQLPGVNKELGQVDMKLQTDGSPKLSQDISQVNGWEFQQQSSQALSTVVQSTRVGGATFFKNAALRKDTESQPQQTTQLKNNANNVNKRPKKLAKRTTFVKNEDKMRKKYGAENSSKRLASSELQNYPPLQLSNLNVLLTNLGKTGNIQQANEEAIKASQRSKMSSLINKTQNVRKTFPARCNSNHDDATMFVTDDKGNIMKVSKSSIFELQNEHRMMPKLQSHTATSMQNEMEMMMHASSQQAEYTEVDTPADIQRKTRLAVNMRSGQVNMNQTKTQYATNGLVEPRISQQDMLNSRQTINLPKSNLNQQYVANLAAQQQPKDRNFSYHYLSQQRLSDHLGGSYAKAKDAVIQFAPKLSEPQQMMITGGHASLSTKIQMGSKKHGAGRMLVKSSDPNKQSNGDLHMVDPQFTITTPTGGVQVKHMKDEDFTNEGLQSSQETLAVNGSTIRYYNGTNVSGIASLEEAAPSDIVEGGSANDVANSRTNSRSTRRGGFHNQNQKQHQPQGGRAVQWQVLNQNQQQMVLGNSSYRETNQPIPLAELSSMPNVTQDSRGGLRQKSQDRKSNQSGGRGGLDSGRSSLQGMLQTVKNQITHGHQQRRSSQNQTTNNYHIVGRAVSPPVKTRDASIQHSDQCVNQKKVGAITEACDAKSSQQPLSSQQTVLPSPSEGAKQPTQVQKVSQVSANMMPIVIQKTTFKKPTDNVVGIQSEDYGGRSQMVVQKQTMEFPRQQLDSQGRDRVVTKRLDSDGQDVTSSRQLYHMMQLDENEYSVKDIVTFLGDSTHSLVRINEGRSRDGMGASAGDTMKLEHTSSKGMIESRVGLKSQEKMQEVSIDKMCLVQEDSIASSRQGQEVQQTFEIQESQNVKTWNSDDGAKEVMASSLNEDSRRQSVLINKEQRNFKVDSQKCSFKVKELQTVVDPVLESINSNGKNQRMQILASNTTVHGEKEESGRADKIEPMMNEMDIQVAPVDPLATPSSAFMLYKVDSSDTMLTVKNLDQLNPSIIVHKDGSRPNFNDVHQQGLSQSRRHKRIKNPPPAISNNTFQNKRKTQGSVQQRMVDQRNKFINEVRQNANSTVSQVYLQPQPEQSQFSFSPTVAANQRSFLPRVCGGKSNFARTQKAIKMIRQGPIQKHRRDEDVTEGGHFMKVQDYAVMHGMLTPSEPLQSEPVLAAMMQESAPFLAGASLQANVKKYSNQREKSDERPFIQRSGPETKQKQQLFEQPLQIPESSSQNQIYKYNFAKNTRDRDAQSHFGETSHIIKPNKTIHSSAMGAWKRACSDGRSTDDDVAQTPKLAGKMLERSNQKSNQSRQPFTFDVQQTQLREGAKVNVTSPVTENGFIDQILPMQPEKPLSATIIGEDSRVHTPSAENAETFVKPSSANVVTGSITITRQHNSPSRAALTRPYMEHQSQTQVAMPTTQIHEQYEVIEMKSMPEGVVDSRESDTRMQRQVIVHKLTMTAPQSFEQKRSSIQIDDQIQEVTSQLNTPENADQLPAGKKLLDSSQKEIASVTEQTSNYYMRKTSETIRDSHLSFENRARNSNLGIPMNNQKQHQKTSNAVIQSRQNIINLWAMPSLNSTVQSQLNATSSSQMSQLASNGLVQSTASKQITNAENKARQFIERQRKRTATLGAQRHNRYNAGYYGKSPPSKTPGAPGRNADTEGITEPNMVTAADQSTVCGGLNDSKTGFLKPAVVDFNGDSLYDSGLIIKKAPMVLNQQKYLKQNRKGLQGHQPLSKLTQNSTTYPSPAATYLAPTYSTGSKEILNAQYQQTTSSQEYLSVLDKPIPGQQPLVQMNVNQLTHGASLTRINHQVLNANPRLLVNNKSPKRHISSPQKPLAFENTARNPGTEQLIMQGSVVLPSGGNRMFNSDGMDDQSAKYRDYLRSGVDLAEQSSSTMRAYTPTLEGWSKQKALEKSQQKSQQQVPVQVFAKRSTKNSKDRDRDVSRFSKNSDIILSGDNNTPIRSPHLDK